MRIGTQNQDAAAAGRAPSAQNTRTPGDHPGDALLADYSALIGAVGNPGSEAAGPAGLAETARRELRDPLGLATEQAAVTASDSPLTEQAGKDASASRKAAGTPGEPTSPDGRGASQKSTAQTADRAGAVPSDQSGRTPTTPKDTLTNTGGQHAQRAEADGQAQSHAAGGVNGARTNGAGVGETGRGGGVRATGGVTGAAGGQAGGQAGSQAGSQSGAQNGSQNGNGQAVLPGQTGAGQQGSSAAALKKLGTASFAQHAQTLRTEHAEVAPQVAKGLASLVLKDGGQAQIQLRPEALGRVDVDLSIKDGVVNATMSAENETARDLLGSELDRLRSMLEQRGLRVERLEIVSAESEREARADAETSRGGRWTPAQDDPHSSGRDAGSNPPGSGGDGRRARGGAPRTPAERGVLGSLAGAAEAGAREGDGSIDAARRRPAGAWVRLDTVA